jgi:hypothetical protein
MSFVLKSTVISCVVIQSRVVFWCLPALMHDTAQANSFMSVLLAYVPAVGRPGCIPRSRLTAAQRVLETADAGAVDCTRSIISRAPLRVLPAGRSPLLTHRGRVQGHGKGLDQRTSGPSCHLPHELVTTRRPARNSTEPGSRQYDHSRGQSRSARAKMSTRSSQREKPCRPPSNDTFMPHGRRLPVGSLRCFGRVTPGRSGGAEGVYKILKNRAISLVPANGPFLRYCPGKAGEWWWRLGPPAGVIQRHGQNNL